MKEAPVMKLFQNKTLLAEGKNSLVSTPFFQPKLAINQPNDGYEQEADAMADKIMRMKDESVHQKTFFAPHISTLRRKCAACEEEEKPKTVQMKPANNFIQKEDKTTTDTAPVPDVTLPTPSLLKPATGPDFLAMRQPFFSRNIFHLWDGDSALHVWQYNFDFFHRFGLSTDLSASLSNFTAPRFIDSQLKAGNPTWWEITDRNLGTTTFSASVPLLDFNADFSPAAPSWLKSILGGGGNSVQRKCAHCEAEEKELHRKESSPGDMAAPAQTENYINSLDGKGRSLSDDERNFFEPGFGYDFSNVKIHTDQEANQSAQDLNALAYTHNNNIVFGSNQHQPQTDAGKRLMAHELTHVVQNKGNANSPVKAKDFSSTGRANEDTPAIINAVVVKSNMLQKYVGLDRIKAALLNSKNFNIIQKYELEEYGKKCKQGSNLDSAGGFFCRNVQDAKDKELKGDIFAVRYLELAYVIHEFMHKLSGLTVKNILGTFINEGITQYLTDLFLAEGKYDILTDHGYMDNLSCANKIVSKTDEETVAKAYFNNDMKLVNDLQKLLRLKSFNDVKPYFDNHQCVPADL